MKSKRNSKSYQAIILAAKNLFWKFGVKRVTVEEICKEAAVSKMTFYRLFSNKNEVAQEMLEQIFKKALIDYRAIMNQEIPYYKKIEQIILMKHQSSNDISEEFVKDVYQNDDSGLKTLMMEYTLQVTAEIMNDMKNAQENGWIRKDIKLEFILYSLNKLQQQISDEHFLSMFENAQEAIMQVTNFFFYGIIVQEENNS